MNSENSKTFEPHRLLLNLTDKIKLNRSDVALSNLSIYYTWKNIKKSYNNKLILIQLQHGMKNLNYLMDHTPYQIFKTILIILSKNMRKLMAILQ